MSSIKTVCTVTKPTSKGTYWYVMELEYSSSTTSGKVSLPTSIPAPVGMRAQRGLQGTQQGTRTSRCRRSAAPRLAIGELRSLAIMMISKSRKLCPGSVRPPRMLPNESFEQLSFRIARCLAPPDRITSGPRALTVTAYAVGRSSSHHSGCNRGTRAPVRDDELRGG